MLSLYTVTEQLIENGEPTVAHKVVPFDAVDEQATAQLLEEVYEQTTIHLPGTPPAYNATAAMYGVKYMYHCCQFALLRTTTPETIEQTLAPWQEPLDASCIVSADLTLKYLPQLHHIIDRLAPDDVLLEQVNACAAAWPLSSVGIKITTAGQLPHIMNNACLRLEYADRIIAHKAKDRLNSEEVVATIQEALGGQLDLLWPEIAAIVNQESENEHE